MASPSATDKQIDIERSNLAVSKATTPLQTEDNENSQSPGANGSRYHLFYAPFVERNDEEKIDFSVQIVHVADR